MPGSKTWDLLGVAITVAFPEATAPDTGIAPKPPRQKHGIAPEATTLETGVAPKATAPESGVAPEATTPEIGIQGMLMNVPLASWVVAYAFLVHYVPKFLQYLS